MVYAQKTTVTADRSRTEIERILARYGADEFGYVTSGGRAAIAFTANSRQVRFVLELPDEDDREFSRTPTGQVRTAAARRGAHDQAVRQRWRALVLVVQAKLEAVESGIVTFEQEFLPHIVLPGGQTVFEATAPAIAAQYDSGIPAPLLQINGKDA